MLYPGTSNVLNTVEPLYSGHLKCPEYSGPLYSGHLKCPGTSLFRTPQMSWNLSILDTSNVLNTVDLSISDTSNVLNTVEPLYSGHLKCPGTSLFRTPQMSWNLSILDTSNVLNTVEPLYFGHLKCPGTSLFWTPQMS